MAKFHINKKGVPAPCKATKGRCPYGGEESHYETAEEAQESADRANEESHGLVNWVGSVDPKPLDADDMLSNRRPRRSWLEEDGMKDYIEKDNLKDSLNKKGVIIEDFDDLSENDLKVLAITTYETTKVRTGNLNGFLNSKKKTNYSSTKEYTREPLKGKFNDIAYKLTLANNVGWHKNAQVGKNDERTALNKLMDKRSLEISESIIKSSEHNEETKDFPNSGLIASVQALRAKGFSSSEIKEMANNERLDKRVYEEYGEKQRKTSGAMEIKNIIQKSAKKEEKDLKEFMKEKLNWSE